MLAEASGVRSIEVALSEAGAGYLFHIEEDDAGLRLNSYQGDEPRGGHTERRRSRLHCLGEALGAWYRGVAEEAG